MKRFFTLCTLLLMSSAVFAQEKIFELKSDGFVSNNPEKPDYFLFDFPEVSQTDLYNSVLLAIGDLFVSPQDVISKVENKQIAVNGFAQNAVERTKMHAFDLNYTIVFEFRDGVIRVNAPSVNKISAYNNKVQEMYVCGPGNDGFGNHFSIYNKKGELKLERAKQTLEDYINRIITEIVAKVSVKSSDEEW